MARRQSKKPLAAITVNLFDVDKMSKGGRKYPLDILAKTVDDINSNPTVIEEISPIERELKYIPVTDVWMEHAMAKSTRAYFEDGQVKVDFDVVPNKYGELLMKTIETEGGIDKMNFMPVGYGNTADDGTVSDYKFCYVTFKVGGNNGNA